MTGCVRPVSYTHLDVYKGQEYYREEQYAQVREQYVTHVQTMLELAGFDDAAQQARAVEMCIRDRGKGYRHATYYTKSEGVKHL